MRHFISCVSIHFIHPALFFQLGLFFRASSPTYDLRFSSFGVYFHFHYPFTMTLRRSSTLFPPSKTTPRFEPRASAMFPIHGPAGRERHHRFSAMRLQRVNLRHIYSVVAAPAYRRLWQRRSNYWQQALEYPWGSNHRRGLREHRLHRSQPPLASGHTRHLAPLHHRGRFW